MRISLDGLGTSLGTYGLEGRARCVPDEVVDRGLPRSLLYNSASVVICLYPQILGDTLQPPGQPESDVGTDTAR